MIHISMMKTKLTSTVRKTIIKSRLTKKSSK
jgi:hypothetical protein